MINFSDVKNIPLGVYEVTVEVRQESEAGELSGVAYIEKFKIQVQSFSDLAFELDDLKVQPIACNLDDYGWTLSLPKLLNPNNLEYEVSYSDESGNFVYDEINAKITLQQNFEGQLVQAKDCPKQSYFLLHLDVLTKGRPEAIRQTIVVPVI